MTLRSSTLLQIMGQVFVWSSHHRSSWRLSVHALHGYLKCTGAKPTSRALGDGLGVDSVVGMRDGDERRGEHGGLEREHLGEDYYGGGVRVSVR